MEFRAPSAFSVGDLILSVADRGRHLIGYPRAAESVSSSVVALAEALMSGRGEASGTARADQMLKAYAVLPLVERQRALVALAHRFGPDLVALERAAAAFMADPGLATAALLQAAAETGAQELIRRLNLAPGGTAALVAMRDDLLSAESQEPALVALDRDFRTLFGSWFNRGFLHLRRIDWSTPAVILDKIIQHEAVHIIRGWDDLRRRLEPADRRLYAFFHPALPDEPLVFVEVALAATIPAAVGPLIAGEPRAGPGGPPTTAVFYSISSTQAGLRGVSFGSFLIKHVVEELKHELPTLQTFVTLSPVPAFAAWLRSLEADDPQGVLTAEDRRALRLLDRPGWFEKAVAVEAVNRTLLPLAAHYLLRARTPTGRIVDPVARFHLGNGARLERLNPLGDRGAKGLATSFGLMVNYLYDPDTIEANHEVFANRSEVVAAAAVRKLLRRPPVRAAARA